MNKINDTYIFTGLLKQQSEMKEMDLTSKFKKKEKAVIATVHNVKTATLFF